MSIKDLGKIMIVNRCDHGKKEIMIVRQIINKFNFT